MPEQILKSAGRLDEGRADGDEAATRLGWAPCHMWTAAAVHLPGGGWVDADIALSLAEKEQVRVTARFAGR
jgi:hypothetical protein